MQDSRPKTSSEQRLFQLYHDVVEMRGEMVCTFDADTRLLQVNDAYAKAFGKTREQLLGQPFIDLIPPSEHENIFRHLAQLQAKKHEVMYEHQVIDGHGNTNWQEWCDRAIFNDDGSLSHFISVGRSINQRKQLEKELKQKHAAESLIARVAKNLVNAELNNLNSSIDEALGEIGAYTNAGRVYVHQYDFERQVLSNTHEWCAEGIEASKPQLQDVPLDLVPEWLEAHKRGERVFIADTASQDVEKSLRIQLQRRGITSLLLLPLIKNGACLGCLGVDLIEKNIHWSASSLTIMDVLAEVITNAIDRIHYEAKLISARDEALQATKEKSSFIATMSHEIRNPLNGVLGMIEMLQKTPLSNEQQHMIQALSSSGTMLLDIVNQASELQKIEQQTRTLRYSDIVVEDLIHEVKLIFEERLSQKKLFFKVENNTEAIGGRLRGAYLPLKQVLVNLTGNAIKFTEEGGITIRVDVQKSSSNQPAMLRFNVMDTGPGIAAKDAEEAFNPYVQLHTASDASIRKEGYGLGLSISKQLVEEMGGEIGAETDEETTAGACFWFSIPEAPPVVSQSAKTPAAGPIPERPAESEPAPASPGLLLAAKPDASIHVLRRQLEVLAFDYVFCTSLHETKVHFDAPDAAYKHLIIDLNLGTKAVLNAISSLKNKPRWWNLNIILLGYNEKDFSSDWKQSYDIREFLVKPLSNEQVAQLLDSGPAVPVAPLTSASATHRAEKVPEEAVYPQLSVLVAEDNQVNQMLIKFILEKLRLKHFDIVPNGARAVEALKHDDYDLVLMDCQMPVMDGFEASQRIRQIDDARKASIPIVAVTAFATQEYSERCLASGMDKYITKPYTLSNIKELLDALVAEGSAPAAEAPDSSRPRSAASPPPVIDMALLHQRFDGDKELIHAMMKQFLDDGYQQIAELRARAGTREWQLFYDVNHQVKGAAATMSATALLQTSEALENVAEKLLKTHDPAQQQQADALIDEMERLFKEAERLTKKWKQA